MTPILISNENGGNYLQRNSYTYQDIDICDSSVVDISLGTKSTEQNIYNSWQAVMSDDILWTDDYTSVRLVSLHLRIFIKNN
jgi:hypothetical protein